MERWAKLDFTPDYEVSNKGRVRRITKPKRGPRRKIPFIVKKQVTTSCDGKNGKARRIGGYEVVHLWVNGKNTLKSVHRLVMYAFRGPSKLQVNHIDGNKRNNYLENLEYCTPAQNRWHAKNTLDSYTYGENHHNSKLNTAQVEAIHVLADLNWSYGKIAKVVGCTSANVSIIARKKGWAHIDPPKS